MHFLKKICVKKFRIWLYARKQKKYFLYFWNKESFELFFEISKKNWIFLISNRYLTM
jgi:hypothetical protein